MVQQSATGKRIDAQQKGISEYHFRSWGKYNDLVLSKQEQRENLNCQKIQGSYL